MADQQPTTQELFSHIDRAEPVVAAQSCDAVAAPTFSNAVRESSTRAQ